MCFKHYTLLSLFFALTLALPAQISISGAVLAGGGGGQEAVPIPDFPVAIISPDSQEPVTVYTDPAGIFNYLDPSVITESGEIWTITTFDPCTLLEPSEEITIEEGVVSYDVVFNICTDIHPPPALDTCVANFHIELLTTTTPTVQFYNTSTVTQSTSVQWDFGDGQGSSEDSPVYTYEDYGIYDVTLTITGDSCVSTITETIQVDSLPCDCDITFDLPVCVQDEETGAIIEFEDICDALCAGYQDTDLLFCPSDSNCFADFHPVIDPEDIFTITFENTSFFFDELDSVYWDFGDGTLSTELSPTHTYAEEGTYEVQLTIFSGDCSDTRSLLITVINNPCDCDITFDLPVCVQDEETGEIIEFGDVCDAFCAGYQSTDILICPSDSSCFANFQPVVNPEDVFTITFENTSFFIGELDSVYWDFGDGTSSAELSPTHTYTEEGTYEVQLSIFNGACSDTRFLPITVAVNPPLPCDCDLSFDFPVCVLDEVTGELIVFEDICDALCAGYGDVDLFVCPSDSSCTADFSTFSDPEDDFTVNFENTSFFLGTLDSVFWDFGDGSVSTENNPTYTYQEAGTFQVQITIFNEDCFDTRVGSVTVGPSPSFDDCQAFFVFDQPDPENLLTYQFFGFSITGVTDSMLWDFGNGVTSTESSPLYTYNEAGTFQVSLTIFSGVDCVSTLAIVINVGDNVWYGSQECRASFLPLIIGDSTEVYFWNTSSSDAISYEWDFGDGNTSTEFEPFYAFPAPAVYTVTLTTTNQDGCVNEYMVIIDLANNNFISMPQFTLLSNTRATSPAAEDIKVFPNPSPAIFTIGWSSVNNSGSVNWQLMDISGRIIEQRKSLNNGRFQIDLGDRPNGVYFLRMETETGTTTKRLIKS